MTQDEQPGFVGPGLVLWGCWACLGQHAGPTEHFQKLLKVESKALGEAMQDGGSWTAQLWHREAWHRSLEMFCDLGLILFKSIFMEGSPSHDLREIQGVLNIPQRAAHHHVACD